MAAFFRVDGKASGLGGEVEVSLKARLDGIEIGVHLDSTSVSALSLEGTEKWTFPVAFGHVSCHGAFEQSIGIL